MKKSITIIFLSLLALFSCKTTELEEVREGLKVTSSRNKTTIMLTKLQFDGNSAETLDYLKILLSEYNGQDVIISGHAANIGDMSAREAISLERATAVANYLIKNNSFDYEVIAAIGKGASEPLGDDDTAQENRRVEITILDFDLIY